MFLLQKGVVDELCPLEEVGTWQHNGRFEPELLTVCFITDSHKGLRFQSGNPATITVDKIILKDKPSSWRETQAEG